MMGHAERAVGNTARNTDQLNIGMGISAVNLRLFHASGREEACGRSRIGFFAAFSKTGRDRNQALLSDANFNKLVGICIGKRSQRSASAGVGAENNNVSVLFSLFHQNFADHLLIRNLIHLPQPPLLSVPPYPVRILRESELCDAMQLYFP